MNDFIREHRQDDPRALMLQAHRYPEIDMRQAVVQISGWQKAQKKLPLWAATDGILFPEHLPMEQCSSQATATYKARLAQRLLTSDDETGSVSQNDWLVTDLTGGFGIDATLLARTLHTARLTFVERNQDLCRLARHNLPLLGVGQLHVLNSTAEDVLQDLPHQHLLYVDPARRDPHGRKTVAISDCTPDVGQLNDLLMEKADYTIVKLSPMLDLSQVRRQLHGLCEIHVVGMDGECKELLIVLSKKQIDTPTLFATDNEQVYTFTDDTEAKACCDYTARLGTYLYEPHAALMKAAPFKSLAQTYQLQKLHPHSHLYTSDTLRPDFPGRIFHIDGQTSFNRKALAPALKGTKNANLSVRNFPLTVAQLRQRLKLSEGGSLYLFATTLADNSHVLIHCTKTKGLTE